MNWPGEWTGNSVMASWMRKFRRACMASEVRPGVGYAVRRTSGGTFLDIGAIGGNSPKIEQFHLTNVFDRYLMCHQHNGEETTEGFAVLKYPELFTPQDPTYTVVQVFGTRWNDYYGENVGPTAGPDAWNVYRKRVDEAAILDTEWALVLPPWIPDDIIYAERCDTGFEWDDDGTARPIEWIMKGSRVWAKVDAPA